MKELVKKELRINWYSIFFILFLPILSLLVQSEDKIRAYLYFSIYVTYLTIAVVALQIMAQENANVVLLFLSLPINRFDIVKSKYLNYSLSHLIASIYFYVYIKYINSIFVLDVENIAFDVVIVSSSIALIVLGLLIPLLYKWSKRLNIIFVLMHILWYLIVFLPIWFPEYFPRFVIDSDAPIDMNFELMRLFLPIIAIIIYSISSKISTKILMKRWSKV